MGGGGYEGGEGGGEGSRDVMSWGFVCIPVFIYIFFYFF